MCLAKSQNFMKFYAKNQSFMLFYAFSLFSKNVMIFYYFMPSGTPEDTVVGQPWLNVLYFNFFGSIKVSKQ